MKSENMVRRPVDRRGIVLILALGMLALFTVVAITLASISRTQATAAGNFKRLEQYGSNTLTVRPDEVNDLFRYALNQLVYDTRNRQSAIRGHSLLRDMYGSPTTYSMTYGTGGGIQSLASIGNNNGIGDGAELRLKRSDLLKLLNITSNNDPRLMALDYQKVYNGTGVFPPRKIDFNAADFDQAVGHKAFQNLYITNPEIAAQIAFTNVPGRLMPNAPTIYPSLTDNAKWQAIFANPFGTPPAGTAYWWPLFPINYTEFDAFSPNGSAITRVATGAPIDPERFTYVVNGGAGTYPQGDHWFGADEDYDYPDVNNMFLAMERADGKMLIPSFHRPGIIAQVADGVNTLTSYGATGAFIGKLPWQPYSTNPPADFHGLVLRPRAADRDAKTLGIASPRAGRFREMADSYIHPPSGTPGLGQDGLPDDLDGSGFIGDHPTELDVDTDGDGQNDSVWVDIGAPVIQVGDSAVKPLFAFKVIGMDGKININTAGNLYKAPNPSYTATGGTYTNPINYTLQHKSNLGASPTEINPQYAMILGDNGGPNVWAMGNVRPPSPIWGFLPGGPTTLEPYQRLLVGYQNLYTGDQAPGRWTGTLDGLNLPGISSADDNGNLMKLDVSSSAKLAQSKSFVASPSYTPDFSRPFEYSAGDGGDPVSTPGSLPAGLPDMVGAFSPVDLYGVGTKYSPYSYTALNPANVATFGLTSGEGNLLSAYLNYPVLPTSLGTTIGGHLKQLNNDTAGATIPVPNVPTASGLPVERFITNEPAETNVYYPSDDYLFTAADIAALLRASDFDATANQSRLSGLLPDQLGRRPIEISAGATTPSPVYYSPESYGRRRMQNLFTHESWDLIRYSAPPTFHSSVGWSGMDKGLFLGPAVTGSPGELLDISVDPTTGFGTNYVESYLARSHSGGAGPNFISQLLNYKLPINNGVGTYTPVASYAAARDVFEQLALAKTADGLDFLIPYEVQMGRRLDLNRPLTAYTRANSQLPNNKVDQERESFAQQIYVLLALSSGTCGLDPTKNVMTPQARFAQSRTVAQIAVNIVDYIDPDNVMTMMKFDPDLSDGWDLTAPLKDEAGTVLLTSGSIDYSAVNTVFGFELPQLVINETLTVITDDNGGDAMTPVRDEYQFSWVELFNPWPAAIDPVSGAPGVSLFANGESVFVLQLNRLNVTNPDGGDSPPNPPVSVDGNAPYKTKDKGMSQLITFMNDGEPKQATDYKASSIADGASAAGATLSIVGGNAADSYFLVGPSANAKTMKTNSALVLPAATPKYFASACGAIWKDAKPTVSTEVPQIDVRLYRKRNPFQDFDRDTNPYIAIDTISQQIDDIESVRPYDERNGVTTAPTTSRTPQKTGLYFIEDPTIKDSDSPDYRPAWAKSVPQPTDVTKINYQSWQRRQPWHGYNGDWQPYVPVATGTRPLFFGTLLGKADQNIEAAFLGLPSLADPRRNSIATNPTGYYTTLDDTNGMRQNGFIPFDHSLGTPNLVAYKRWEVFPFLNRQLATPLELLSVRLYGSHLWYTMGGGTKEWRLRFTDDFEFFPHPWYPKSSSPANPFFERLWRSRQVPWFQDSRVSHPTFLKQGLPTNNIVPATTFTGINPLEVQLPLPHLYRFFELVECRSRMNNGVPASQQWIGSNIPSWPTIPAKSALNPNRVLADPTFPTGTVLATQRMDRAPGKINLNLITDEEVYKALIDSVETTYYDLITDHLKATTGNLANYQSAGNYTVAVSSNFWPTNYWWTTTTSTPQPGALFSPLGQAPLGSPGTPGSPTKVLDVIDALGRMVAWSSLTLNNTTSVTVTTPPSATASAAVLSTGGFDIGAYRLFGSSSGLGLSTTDLYSTPGSNTVIANSSALMGLSTYNIAGSPNRQFPGIVIGADPNYTLYPGTDPNRQVHSEMYRAFLLSRSGHDGIHGTADDKPFRSFASDDVSDTILRVRNSATNGLIKEGGATFNGSDIVGVSVTDAQSIVAKTYVDGADDLVTVTNPTPALSFYIGDYITRLGGQRSPGLFDPIPDPYSDYLSPDSATKDASIPHLLPIGADPSNVEFQKRLPTYTNGSPEKLPVDYWVLEERRNELLAKISGNVTTRSHVFAVWMAVGFFRVEPGTEGLKVPLLGAEVGSESGKAFRHRAFFIIDRSQAKSYDPEDIDANFDFDIMRQKKLLEYYKIIE